MVVKKCKYGRGIPFKRIVSDYGTVGELKLATKKYLKEIELKDGRLV